MARNRKQQRDTPDREIDLHGMTSGRTRATLERHWASRQWHGLQRVRVIHGTGDVLHAVVRLWCEEKGIEWTTESWNPGVTILLPGRRLQTPAPPPHRPLNGLKKHLPKAPAARPTPLGGASSSDEDLFAQEMDRLSAEKGGSLGRLNRSTDPSPDTARESTTTAPPLEN